MAPAICPGASKAGGAGQAAGQLRASCGRMCQDRATPMTISIVIGAVASVAALVFVIDALRRRDPEHASTIGSVSQSWVAEHRSAGSDDGLR